MSIAPILALLNITEDEYNNYNLFDSKPKLLVKDAKEIIIYYENIFNINLKHGLQYYRNPEFKEENVKTIEIHIVWCLYILSHYKTANCLGECYIKAIKTFIINNMLNKQLVLIILSLQSNGYTNFRNLSVLRDLISILNLINVLSCEEMLQLCSKNTLVKIFNDHKNIINKYDEWINIFMEKNNFNYLFDFLLFKEINKDKLLKCLELFKKYDNKNLLFKIYIKFSNLIKPDYQIINNSYNSSILLSEYIPYIKKLNIKKVSNSLYADILFYEYKTWAKYPNFSKETLIVAYKQKYYDIIIEHYSKQSYWDINDNLHIKYLLKEPIDYKNVKNVIKNCPSFNIDIVLDSIDTRFENLNCVFPEFCLNYISQDKITIKYLKKFLRINSYLKDLDRFNIIYDQVLYNICAIFKTYPPEYIGKMNIDKNILFARMLNGDELHCYLSNNNIDVDEFMFAKLTTNTSYEINDTTYYQTIYTILTDKLFKFKNITNVDNEIITILEKHFNV